MHLETVVLVIVHWLKLYSKKSNFEQNIRYLPNKKLTLVNAYTLNSFVSENIVLDVQNR